MTGHASTLNRPHAVTPRDALAAFIRAGRRETLIGELARSWYKLGRAEVEEAVDAAIADAAVGMHATREAAIYEYLRTAAQRRLGRRKERAERTSTSLPDGMDFDCVVGDSLSPEELVLAKEHRDVVLDLVSALDDRTLAVMRLKHVDGLERKQVAEVLGISEKAVKKAIERGHRECRESFEAAMRGQLCGERTTALAALAGGSASPRQRRQAEQHLRHCASCRQQQRALAAAQRAVAALVPAPVVGSALMSRVGGFLSRCGDWISGFVPTSATAADASASVGSKAIAVVAAAAIAGGGVYGAGQIHAGGSTPRSPAAKTRAAAPARSPGSTTLLPVTADHSSTAPPPARTARSPLQRPKRRTSSRRAAVRQPTAATPAPAPAPAPTSAPATTSTSETDEFPIF